MHVRVYALDTSPQAIQPSATRALCNEMVNPEDTIAIDMVPGARAIGITKLCPGCVSELVERVLTTSRTLTDVMKLPEVRDYVQKLMKASREKPPWPPLETGE